MYRPPYDVGRFFLRGWFCGDGRNIVYEVFRNIQVKRPFIKQIDHQFAWTGTKPPTVTSDLQAIRLVGTEAGASRLRFILPHVRVFNEIHATPRYPRKQAVLTKTKLDENGPLIAETIAKIKFEGITKSCEYNLTDPTPGYRYRLKWTRPTHRDLARSK